MEPAEQDRIKAFVINKFRGDLSLLTPGLEWLEQRTGIPVAGVIPYYHEIYIPEEDSMALEKRRALKLRQDYDLDIAVIGLPHISNFDDFDPLLRETGVRLRYVETADDLGEPDLIILPGTKSTVADLAYLRTTGRDCEIIRQASQGVALIGICGGYQILGRTINDPDKIESTAPQTMGLGLLPVTTHFLPMKSTHQIKAAAVLKWGLLAKAQDIAISGYEIHMGQTSGENISQPFCIAQRADKFCSDFDGAMSEDGSVLGTYIHGLFHNHHLRRAVLAELAERKGRSLPAMTSSFSIEEQYDKLAVHVRQSLNMELVLRLLDHQ